MEEEKEELEEEEERTKGRRNRRKRKTEVRGKDGKSVWNRGRGGRCV